MHHNIQYAAMNAFASPSKRRKNHKWNGWCCNSSCNCFFRILMQFILDLFIYIHRVVAKTNFPVPHIQTAENSIEFVCTLQSLSQYLSTHLFASCTITGNENEKMWWKKGNRNSISSVIFFNQKLIIFQKNDVNALQNAALPF